ncbi:MAG: Cadmium-transporting ATPase [Paracidovorax wautersii]|uniref:P-type Zn(2+) transporter n=1 Tax=Paracidovorax wautersii TaxID=1177982 RepID=A0A7V8FN68_9BURK|nr:MAG: Cadmium-transporting ATPase [Paracidovorax wautersii]
MNTGTHTATTGSPTFKGHAPHPAHEGHAHGHAHDHAHGPAHDHDHDHGDACCGAPAAIAQARAPLAGGHRLRLPDMDCAVEANEIRGIVEPVAGIRDLHFDLAARVLTVDADAPVAAQAFERIRRAGFRAEAIAQDAPTPAQADDHGGAPGLPRLAGALALGAIVLSGFEVYRKGLVALRHGRLNINALMTVAVTGAVLIGQWPEAAMVMALYATAELIEARAAERARGAIRDLLDTGPQQAQVRQADDSWQLQDTATIAVGAAIIRTRPGERIALDGAVQAGTSTVNQAPITGESLPVDKAVGDAVYAGSINETGMLDIRVTSATGHNLIDRIIAAVEQAQQSRAPTQRFVDQFARIYTPAVFGVALAVAVLLPLLAGWTWLDAAYKALVLLVIACPCALVISTPVTVVSGLTVAARRGILLKGGNYLEGLRRLRAVALDKTGTLTTGKPSLVAWERVDEDDQDAPDASVRDVARALAAQSDHPVSIAIAAGLAAEPDADRPTRAVEAFQALPGRGVQGQVNGARYHLGNHRLIEELGLCGPALEARLAAHERQGRTVTLLAGPSGVLALFAVADTLKPTSAAAVAQLQALGVVPVMLSGDNQTTASTIAAQAGITEARGDLLPDHKQEAIAALQRQYGPTAMTGDGINDAPALAQADIGLAMGGAGTDTAIETADVVIMNDDLRHIPEAIRLSRRTHAVLWQNITLALGIKAVFFVLALTGNASMWMAVFADMGASLLVVANGLRLLRDRRA